MSLMHAKYPNLELLEFKARVMLSKDSEFTEEVDKSEKENKYRSVEFEAIVFLRCGEVHAPALMF